MLTLLIRSKSVAWNGLMTDMFVRALLDVVDPWSQAGGGIYGIDHSSI